MPTCVKLSVVSMPAIWRKAWVGDGQVALPSPLRRMHINVHRGNPFSNIRQSTAALGKTPPLRDD
jgi:hypothetical protein